MLLTDEQISELERQLCAAEAEWRYDEYNRRPRLARELLEFKAIEYIRRLLEDIKHYRATTAQK